ncbi:MAG: PTS sugar transporter subunit IIB [Erysipelotrichia bacterium]|nr:PTS sugar transporter subunit IIB [Erysipelotrichia bacterium]
MYKIVLCCQNGASTDLLAVKMEEAAQKKGIEVSVNAHPYTDLGFEIENADLILLAPQIRFKKNTLEKMYASYNKPFMCIDPSDYGLLKGDHVLEQALKIIESANNK